MLHRLATWPAALEPPARRFLGRALILAVAVSLALVWANSRILALRQSQDPARPLVLSGYYVFHAMAAALEEKAIGRVELRGGLASLKEVLEKNWAYGQAPEVFCFGLLEMFDIPHLRALVSPRPLVEKVAP